MDVVTIIIIAVVVVLVLAVLVMYNGLVRLKNTVQESWAQIETQLKRRADLIPNLVETVKGYAKHESSVFEAVTNARAGLLQNTASPKAAGEASNMLTDALGKLFAVAENYPGLRATENFQQLQEQLTNTENLVSFARQRYNDVVRDFNTRIEVVPSNIIASIAGFKQAEYFQIENPAEREVPEVKF
ncbi:MAG: LemA family protein [Bifidobacteriaceae bacterium]|jgi:LemA protein|nr:LemA family protein [Bifidobacteriaceae bacterium]